MPELPEVETVVRSLAGRVSGNVILEASFTSKRVTRRGFAATSKALRGAVIQRMDRRGKHILIHLDRGLLHVHLGMTGKLLWNADTTPYTRAVIELTNGVLVYDDVRQFGRVEFYSTIPKNITALGPEPLDIAFEEFEERLRARGLRIKALLLDQRFLAGIGNIYADEALFAAGIHPGPPMASRTNALADYTTPFAAFSSSRFHSAAPPSPIMSTPAAHVVSSRHGTRFTEEPGSRARVVAGVSDAL